MDNQTGYYFAITHKDDPTVVLKHLIVPAETQEVSTDFANQGLEEYKKGLSVESEKFEQAEFLGPPMYPENLVTTKGVTGFAWFPTFLSAYKELADIAEAENWDYHFTPTKYEKPLLVSYIKHTYKRLALEEKIAISKNSSFSCFNTGLVTDHQEQIYASFKANSKKKLAPWVFNSWLKEGDQKLKVFPKLPETATYFNDPSCLFFDARKRLETNYKHILENSRRERFPEPYKTMSDHALQSAIKGSINNTLERVHRNYKMAIPSYYRGKIHFLLPLYLKDSKRADLALAVEANKNDYRVATCLTLDMAYNDARLLAKPDKEWLIP